MSGSKDQDDCIRSLGPSWPLDPRDASLIPQLILESIDAYALEGRPVGSFLEAVLSHELFEAVAFADGDSMRGLCAIVCYIHNKVPAICHGSKGVYELWVELTQLDPGADQDECKRKLLAAKWESSR